ncbi:MAG: SDR family oxidoreductase [Caulobacteraceae bacterium]|nr:SDR family oxidoreductase [Caulobacteraceae bacterium]
MPLTLSGLDGKVAVVTGAGRMRGFGRAIALRLAQGGCDVIVTESDRPSSEFPEDERQAGWKGGASVVAEVQALGRRAESLTLDVRDEQAVDAFVDEALQRLGRVDILVNNAAAATGVSAPAVSLPTETWRSKLSVNLDGAFFMSRALGRRMVDQGRGGCIVNISSIAGKMFLTNSSAYSASKAGLQALTACMAQELASAAVRVNAVCPGFVDTSHSDPNLSEETRRRILDTVGPRLRPGRVDDIANMVAFLCSEEGSWITGQSFNVDGGRVVAH